MSILQPVLWQHSRTRCNHLSDAKETRKTIFIFLSITLNIPKQLDLNTRDAGAEPKDLAKTEAEKLRPSNSGRKNDGQNQQSKTELRWKSSGTVAMASSTFKMQKINGATKPEW